MIVMLAKATAFEVEPAVVLPSILIETPLWAVMLSPPKLLTAEPKMFKLPELAVMLTWPKLKSMSPTVTLLAAKRRAVAVAPVLVNKLVALCVMLPVPASTSMLPLPAAVLVVLRSAVPVKFTLRAANTLRLPLLLLMPLLLGAPWPP